jgi:hypothetical protein
LKIRYLEWARRASENQEFSETSTPLEIEVIEPVGSHPKEWARRASENQEFSETSTPLEIEVIEPVGSHPREWARRESNPLLAGWSRPYCHYTTYPINFIRDLAF